MYALCKQLVEKHPLFLFQFHLILTNFLSQLPGVGVDLCNYFSLVPKPFVRYWNFYIEISLGLKYV